MSRMTPLILVLILSILLPLQSTAQNLNEIYEKNELAPFQEQLAKSFLDYEVFSLDVEKVFTDLDAFRPLDSYTLNLGKIGDYKMQLFPEENLNQDMKVTLASGKIYDKDLNILPYKGKLRSQNNSSVRLTIAPDFFSAIIRETDRTGMKTKAIEPLRNYIENAPRNLYIIFDVDEVIISNEHKNSKAIVTRIEKTAGDIANKSMLPLTTCFTVEISLANDFLMLQEFDGDIAEMLAHNITILNFAQDNFDNDFEDELQLEIVEQYVSDCASCNPWTESTDIVILRNDFRPWALLNFTEEHDMGFLWSARDFDNGSHYSTFAGVACTDFKYGVFERYTGGQSWLKNMMSKVIGFQLNAFSDPENTHFIMTPGIVNHNQWSPQSIEDITNYYSSLSCLSSCPAANPPSADFSSQLNDLCTGTTVQFLDESEGLPFEWSWTFPGGTPSSSIEKNPFVTYEQDGVYNVFLTVTGRGGVDTEIKNGFITVGSSGQDIFFFEDFSEGLENWTVTNPDNSWTWDTEYVVGSSGDQNTIIFNNYVYQGGVGQLDYMDSESIDLSGRENVNLSLEYAYTRFDAGTQDIFRIKISTNGGNSFPHTIFTGQEDGSGDFATVEDMGGLFGPLEANDWCFGNETSASCIYISLEDFQDETDVVIRFENQSDYGNSLHLDNLMLTSSCLSANPPEVSFNAETTSGCAPLVVQFEDLSTNSPTSWNWEFPGGTPSSSTLQNPIVTYSAVGSFSVSFTAENDYGSNTIVENNYIMVSDVPSPGFDFIISGQNVNFINTSTNADSYSWDFGDNTSSAETNPLHMFDQNGTYEVILSAFNSCGLVTVSSFITISTEPAASISQDVTSGCADLVVTFSGESSENVENYFWAFDGGIPATSTEVNPIVTYENEGIYDVSLIVSNNSDSDTITLEQYITVTDVPEAGYNTNVDNFVVEFINSSVDATTFSWDFGDGNSSAEESPTHTYLVDGVFTVTLTATNDCGSNEFSVDIFISNLPTAQFMSNVTAGCAPVSISFEDNSGGSVESRIWNFEGGSPASSTEASPIIEYVSEGVYDVELIVTNGEGSDTLLLTEYITINVTPDASFTTAGNELTYEFTNNSIAGDTYLWNFGDTNTSEEENPTHTYDVDGEYEVILIVANECGTSEFTSTISVVSSINAAFSSDVVTGCADLVVQYSDISTGTGTAWLWNFPGGTPSTSTEQNPTITYSEAGIYEVSLEVSNDGFTSSISETEYIIVSDVPVNQFNLDATLLDVSFENLTLNGNSFVWEFGDGEMSTDSDPTHSYASEGEYTVTLTSTNECGSSTSTLDINLTLFPLANFSSDITEGCITLQVQYEDFSSPNTSEWEWIFEGGNPAVSFEQNPLVSYEEAGEMDVTLIAKNDLGNDTIILSDYILVQGLPLVETELEVVDNVASLSVLSDNSDSYSWTNLATGEMYAGSELELTLLENGLYEIELISTNECGSVSNLFVFQIEVFPTAQFSNSLTDGCTDLTVDFIDQSLSNIVAWEWEFEGGIPSTSSDSNPSILYPSIGVYDVRLIVANSFGKDTILMENIISIEDQPTASFDFELNGPEATFTNTSLESGSYLWDFGDTNQSIEENPIHTYEVAGSYNVTLLLETQSNCADEISKEVITIVNKIDDYDLNSIKIYPIPTQNNYTLEVDNDYSGQLQFQVINSLGQIIETKTGNKNAGLSTFYFESDLPSGLYFLSIHFSEKSTIKRFIIKR